MDGAFGVIDQITFCLCQPVSQPVSQSVSQSLSQSVCLSNIPESVRHQVYIIDFEESLLVRALVIALFVL